MPPPIGTATGACVWSIRQRAASSKRWVRHSASSSRDRRRSSSVSQQPSTISALTIALQRRSTPWGTRAAARSAAISCSSPRAISPWGGRTKPDGSVDFTNLDHGDASDAVQGVTLTPENPLAGLNRLARQVRASGITQVTGDVVIDDRLLQPDPNLDPRTHPIIINDNLIDVVVTPGQVGTGPGVVTWRPQVPPYHLAVQVKTVSAGQPTALAVQLFPAGRVLVSGTIAADAGQQVRVGAIPDPSAFAHTALIEALGRAGVSVRAAATGPNPLGTLPATSSYQGAPRVAAYVSPPFSEYTTLIFKISSNVGADLMLCLMAAKAGSTNCADGFPVLASFLARAHVDRQQVVL